MSVIIVGAGISGLAAAAELLENDPNRDVTILEASEEIGGRIKTVKKGDMYFELGAQWIHGSNKRNSMYRIAQDLNNISHTDEDYCEFYKSNGDKVSRDISDRCCEIFDIIQEKFESGNTPDYLPDTSVADYFNNELLKYYKEFTEDELDDAKNVFKQLLRMNECYMGALLTDVCINDPYVNTGQNTCVKEGLAKICYHFQDRIYKANRTKDIIKLNHKVEKIVLKKSTVKVECSNGSELSANHVLITLPLGVLKQPNHLFDPPLPKTKQDAINRIGFGLVGKFFLYYEKPFWNDSNSYSFIPSTDYPKSWKDSIQGFFKVDNNSNFLIGWLVGPNTFQYESVSNEELKNTSVDLLKTYLKNSDIPEPDEIFRFNYCTNELFKGCYSYISMETRREDFNNYSDPILDDNDIPRILFAGEATCAYAYSTMHGALDSGKREAYRILNLSSSKNTN